MRQALGFILVRVAGQPVIDRAADDGIELGLGIIARSRIRMALAVESRAEVEEHPAIGEEAFLKCADNFNVARVPRGLGVNRRGGERPREKGTAGGSMPRLEWCPPARQAGWGP